MNRSLAAATLVLVTALSLYACGSDAPPPAAAPKAPTAAAPVAAKPKAAAADAGISDSAAKLEYSYQPVGKRDPFKGTLVLQRATPTEGEQRDRCSEPLCQYDIEDLSLVAVVSGDANPMGMVEDHSGVGYLVRRNTKIGKQGGKVTSIQRNCIQITNFVTTADGKSQPNRTDLCVKVDEKMRDPLDLLKNKVD